MRDTGAGPTYGFIWSRSVARDFPCDVARIRWHPPAMPLTSQSCSLRKNLKISSITPSPRQDRSLSSTSDISPFRYRIFSARSSSSPLRTPVCSTPCGVPKTMSCIFNKLQFDSKFLFANCVRRHELVMFVQLTCQLKPLTVPSAVSQRGDPRPCVYRLSRRESYGHPICSERCRVESFDGPLVGDRTSSPNCCLSRHVLG